MKKVILVPMHPVNLFSSNYLRELISDYRPDIIGVEETQKDIDDALTDSQSGRFLQTTVDKLNKQSYLANNKTIISLAKSEMEFYSLLRAKKEQYKATDGRYGARIIGCDNDSFPANDHETAIKEYYSSKKQFFKGLLKLSPDEAKEIITKSYDTLYNAIVFSSSSEELLHNSFDMSGDSIRSPQMREYYKQRDEDTAARIRELLNEEITKKDGKILYLFNITHLDPNYPNLAFLLKDIRPEIMPFYESDN